MMWLRIVGLDKNYTADDTVQLSATVVTVESHQRHRCEYTSDDSWVVSAIQVHIYNTDATLQLSWIASVS